MISIENKPCCPTVSSTKKVKWNYKLHEKEEDHDNDFITLRKSRKGTNLSDPSEFCKIPKEQSTIKRMMVLPTGGCCDLDYVTSQKKQSKKQLSSKKSIQQTTSVSYPASITINIGPSMPFHLNPALNSTYNSLQSSSHLPKNTRVLTEEKWQPDDRIIPCIDEEAKPVTVAQPYGDGFPYVISREQRIIDFKVLSNTDDDDNVTYLTKSGPPPKISPFKSCWNCLRCKRKGKEDEIYLPSIMNKNAQPTRNVIVYPLCSAGTSFDANMLAEPNFSKMNTVPSRLSTIAELEMSSQNLSEPEMQNKNTI